MSAPKTVDSTVFEVVPLNVFLLNCKGERGCCFANSQGETFLTHTFPSHLAFQVGRRPDHQIQFQNPTLNHHTYDSSGYSWLCDHG